MSTPSTEPIALPETPLHELPRIEDLIGVAAELARTTGAAHVVLALDPRRFSAGAVASPGCPPSLLEGLRDAATAAPATGEVRVVLDPSTSRLHRGVADELRRAGIGRCVGVALTGPGGGIGAVELLFREGWDLPEAERTRLRLDVERAAMNVVNVRLFGLVERAKKEWEATFDAIRDGISIHGRDCTIRRANWGLGLMLGTTPSQLVGRTCHEAIFGLSSRCRSCPFPAGSAPGAFRGREYESLVNGRAVHVSMYPLSDDDGKVAGMVHIVRDISQRKEEEQEFRRMHEELVRAHGVLQGSMEQLKAAQAQLVQSEKMAAVGQLISGVAHELNNPLTGIIGYSQLLGDGSAVSTTPQEKLSRFVHNMGKEAVRCQKIVQNLLLFARRSEAEKQPTDINEVVRRTVELKAYDLRVNDVELVLELADGLPRTMADQNQLQQVLLNLVQNAAQAIKSGRGKGTITVRTRGASRPSVPAGPGAASRWLVLEVQDDGPGFTEDVKARMFDPFFTTKDVGQGTGLGLSICYGIVKEHQGHVTAEHAEGGGALFRVELPVQESQPPRAAGASPRAAQVPVEPGRRVLVVDDEATICDMVRDVLALDGYVVDTARNGEAGLDALARSEYDCVLVDLKMPGIDGARLHETLAARDPGAARRMVFMTGDVLSDTSREFLERTGNAYLAKPFAIHDMRAAVARVVAAAAAR